MAAGCAKAAELGFDAVEVFPRSAAELDVGLLRSCLERHQLKLAAMGTGTGWVVKKLRLTDHEESVRSATRSFIREIVDIAGSFGAPAIIGSMQGRAEGGLSHEQHLVWLAEALDELAPRATEHGTTLLIEPLNRYETNLINSVADGVKLIGSLKATNVKLLCDLFHMNLEEVDIARIERRWPASWSCAFCGQQSPSDRLRTHVDAADHRCAAAYRVRGIFVGRSITATELRRGGPANDHQFSSLHGVVPIMDVRLLRLAADFAFFAGSGTNHFECHGTVSRANRTHG